MDGAALRLSVCEPAPGPVANPRSHEFAPSAPYHAGGGSGRRATTATKDSVTAIVKRFRRDLDADRDIKSDVEITDTDRKTRTICIYGSPENHSLFRRVNGDLPIVFEPWK